MVVGRLLSYWDGLFSGAILNFGRVVICPNIYLKLVVLGFQELPSGFATQDLHCTKRQGSENARHLGYWSISDS